MENFHQRICESQKALLAHAHHVQALFLDGFEKFVSLNLHTVRSRFDDAADQVRSTGMQSGLPDTLAQFTHRIQHQFDRSLAYGNQLGEIIGDLQSGLRELTLTELGHVRHTAAAALAPVQTDAKGSVRQNQTAATPPKDAVAKAPSAKTPPAKVSATKTSPAKTSPAKTSSIKAASPTGRKTASLPRPAKPRAASTVGEKRPAAVVKQPAAPAARPAASAAPVAARQPAAKPVAPAVPSARADTQPPASVPAAPAANKQAGHAAPRAVAVPEAPKAVPAVPSAQVATQQQASVPATPAAVRVVTARPSAPVSAAPAASVPAAAQPSADIQSPANVISHLVAQTTPAASKKDSSKA